MTTLAAEIDSSVHDNDGISPCSTPTWSVVVTQDVRLSFGG